MSGKPSLWLRIVVQTALILIWLVIAGILVGAAALTATFLRSKIAEWEGKIP